MGFKDGWRNLIPREPDAAQAEFAEAWGWIGFWSKPIPKQYQEIIRQANRKDKLDSDGRGLERSLLDMRRFGYGLAHACERVLTLLDSSHKNPEDGEAWIPPRKLREMRERGEDYQI